MLNEIQHAVNPKKNSPVFEKTGKTELLLLVGREVFRVVCKQDFANGPNILGALFPFTTKSTNTYGELSKARFVVQGHTDT